MTCLKFDGTRLHLGAFEGRVHSIETTSEGETTTLELQVTAEEENTAEVDDSKFEVESEAVDETEEDGRESGVVNLTCFDVSVGTLATGSEDGSTGLWSTQSGNCVKSWVDHKEKVSGIKLVDNSLYTVGYDGYFFVRNLEHDRIVHSFTHCTCPLSCILVPHPNNVLIGSWDGTVRALNLSSRSVDHVFQPNGHSPIRCLELSDDILFIAHGNGVRFLVSFI